MAFPIRTFGNLINFTSFADVLHADPVAAVQRLGGDQAGDQSHWLDNFDVNLDPVLCIQRAAVRVESDGGGHHVR